MSTTGRIFNKVTNVRFPNIVADRPDREPTPLAKRRTQQRQPEGRGRRLMSGDLSGVFCGLALR